MDTSELRAQAREDADDLGPEPIDRKERAQWKEERRGAVVLLAALADDDPAILRRGALEVATELSNRPATALLLDAAADVARGRA